MKNQRFDVVQDYEGFLDVEEDYDPSEKSSESDVTDRDLEAVAESAPREEKNGKEKTDIPANVSPSLKVPEKEVFLYGQYEKQEKKFQIPSLSKRTLRKIERAKKKVKQTYTFSSHEETPHRTYKDIDVVVDPEADAEVESQFTKVKCLLSYLANGEGYRGKLKPLKGKK